MIAGPNQTLAGWRAALDAANPILARELREDVDPYRILADYGLPTPAHIAYETIAAYSRLSDEVAIEPLVAVHGVTSFYVGGRPLAPGLDKFRSEQPLRASEIRPFVDSQVDPEDRASYSLRIAEFLSEIAVTAIIDPDGTADMDIAQGTLPPLTSGTVTPDFHASNRVTGRNPFGKLQYFGREPNGTWSDVPIPTDDSSLLNTPTRTALWRSIKDMRQATPGYYESLS